MQGCCDGTSDPRPKCVAAAGVEEFLTAEAASTLQRKSAIALDESR